MKNNKYLKILFEYVFKIINKAEKNVKEETNNDNNNNNSKTVDLNKTE